MKTVQSGPIAEGYREIRRTFVENTGYAMNGEKNNFGLQLLKTQPLRNDKNR